MKLYRPGWLIRLMSLAAGALLAASAQGASAQSFYNVSAAEMAGQPGSIIRSERFDGLAAGGTAYRVLYRSTGLRGQPIAVSGLIIVPNTPAPAGGRRVVAWAHDTIGVARHCAVSAYPQALSWIPGLELMLARGYVVTATDYEGLGAPGVHPYLVGESAGKSVLDSVRAARSFAPARAGSTFAVWGHSQGGHAALFSGQMARSYAPDLRLVGVAASSPAAELRGLFGADASNPVGKMLGTFAVWSWSRVYGISLSRVLVPTAPLVFERVAQFCNDGPAGLGRLLRAAQPLEREGFLSLDLTKSPRWEQLMALNTPGRVPPGAPVFIAQGTSDYVVKPRYTQRFVQQLCRHRAAVSLNYIPGGGHTNTHKFAAPAAVAWMADRFAGAPAPNNC
jgi:acetyl esterase/lipase